MLEQSCPRFSRDRQSRTGRAGPAIYLNLSSYTGAGMSISEGDLVAISELWLEKLCHSYLYRIEITGYDCESGANVNQMQISLDRNGNDVLNVGLLDVNAAAVTEFQGTSIFNGNVTFNDDIDVKSTMDLAGDLTVRGDYSIESFEIDSFTTDVLTVNNNLTVPEMQVTGDMTMTTQGTAIINDLNTEIMTVETLFVDQVSADVVDTDRLDADNIITSTCTGSTP